MVSPASELVTYVCWQLTGQSRQVIVPFALAAALAIFRGLIKVAGIVLFVLAAAYLNPGRQQLT